MESSGPPNDMAQLRTAISRQLKYYIRTWRFYGLLGFVLLVTVAFTVVSVVQNSGGSSGAAYLNNAAGNLAIFGIIIGAFIGGDAIAMDFGSGTGYFTLVLPVRRSVLLLGRYIAAFSVTFALVLIYYVVALVGAVHFWGVGGIPWLDLFESMLLAALYALAVLSTAFFFSSLFRTPAVSMVATILILFLGFLFVDGIVGSTLGYEPWFSILYAGQVIGLVLVGAPHDITTPVGIGGSRMVDVHTWNPYIWEGTAILLGYFLVFLLLSLVIYQRKESKG